MGNKATIEIDCDAGTVTVLCDMQDMAASGFKPVETTRAELVATILAMQSKELMSMSTRELMARHLVMMEPKQ